MSFKKNKFLVIKNIISKEICKFAYDYLLLKKQAAATLFDKGFVNRSNLEWGTWNDSQVDGTYSIYADLVTEVLLERCKPIMEKHLKMKLVPTYSYCRVYEKGSELVTHTDRKSCEFSTTLNLGGDAWPIYLAPDNEINLSPGDMLIYKGCEVEHWREPFTGNVCVQTFLHYNKEGDIKYDYREHLGLPVYTKTKRT